MTGPLGRLSGAEPGFLDKERIIAAPGFNRWLVPPAALLGELQAYGAAGFGLQARPLVAPQVAVPIALMLHQGNHPSRTLEAALALAEDPARLAEAAQHSGLLLQGR